MKLSLLGTLATALSYGTWELDEPHDVFMRHPVQPVGKQRPDYINHKPLNVYEVNIRRARGISLSRLGQLKKKKYANKFCADRFKLMEDWQPGHFAKVFAYVQRTTGLSFEEQEKVGWTQATVNKALRGVCNEY